MDAIIFFYKKRELDKPQLTVTREKGYRLIRVGICGGENSWFGRSVPALPEAAEEADGRRDAAGNGAGSRDGAEGGIPGRADGFRRRKRFPAGLILRRRERKRRREEARERERQRKSHEEAVRALEQELRDLSEEILSKTKEPEDCVCVYTDGAKAVLAGGGILAKLWKNCWQMQELADYRTYGWVEPLLPYAVHPDYVLLGTAPCVPEAVRASARGMRSLRWILREKDCGGEEQDFVEEFYEEYGLAIIVQTVQGRNGFRSLCLEAAKPVCVLDFTDEVKFFWGGLAPGSVWLDFSSQEEKGRRMERLAPGISYFSMKKLWCG